VKKNRENIGTQAKIAFLEPLSIEKYNDDNTITEIIDKYTNFCLLLLPSLETNHDKDKQQNKVNNSEKVFELVNMKLNLPTGTPLIPIYIHDERISKRPTKQAADIDLL
jgi:RNase H-fold protein (predicted Holliday junction resolvase)